MSASLGSAFAVTLGKAVVISFGLATALTVAGILLWRRHRRAS